MTKEAYWPGGELKYRQYYVGQSSICKAWYKNGQIAYICHYRRGQFHGTCEYWDADGKLLNKISYFDGKEV